MKFTSYFVERVTAKRPSISKLWCRRAIISPIQRLTQPDGRIRHWIFIPEAKKYLRVVTLSDGETVHNAFFDRNFKEGKIHYDTEADSLYIELSPKNSIESEEVAPGVVLDFDAKNHVVGIDIEHASTFIDTKNLVPEVRVN